ncbi:MAG: Branched-chain alpha-keto acid dehydrogenase, component, alpha subunit protein [Myxococcales bacterium]|nr:Branched-chain alpha-keto acid dehydrogenase, component, alpha subunit protein [Myxococcales bacterium]
MLAKGQPVPIAGTDDEPFSILADDGTIRPGTDAPEIPDEQALKLYRGMLQVRLVDDRMMKLQRQGRLGFYMLSMGEEATHFGGAYPLRMSDWCFPSYREPGVFFWRGYSIKDYVNQLHGNIEDPVKGRQMPVHHSANWLNMVSISSPVGTQIPQAVGLAMGAKISKKDDVSLVYFGEGATSTGQFHVAMNFAGVFKAPCILFCRNNGWAISTPGNKQTASKSIAIKALAYGMPGIRVDGNDLLAIIAVMQDAVARARAGEGPTLIEAVTYRRGGHSSSDDPSAYRDPSEPKEWEAKDPLERWRRHLESRKLWTQELHDKYSQEITEELMACVKAAGELGNPAPETLFDDVFAELPPHLEEQKAEMMSRPRPKPAHGGH